MHSMCEVRPKRLNGKFSIEKKNQKHRKSDYVPLIVVVGYTVWNCAVHPCLNNKRYRSIHFSELISLRKNTIFLVKMEFCIIEVLVWWQSVHAYECACGRVVAIEHDLLKFEIVSGQCEASRNDTKQRKINRSIMKWCEEHIVISFSLLIDEFCDGKLFIVTLTLHPTT